MTVFVVMEWDEGEQRLTGVGYTDEDRAKDQCKDSDGWLEYVAIKVIE